MSKVVHRKPVWGWSVVLLSTLLLSPAASSVVLHALACAAQSEGAPVRTATLSAASPRRADDEESLRARARGEQPLKVRLDTQPEPVALIVSALTVQLVPDDAPAVFSPSDAAPLGFRAVPPTPPRAPPA